MNDNLIKRLNQIPDFNIFKEWLAMQIIDLDSVGGIGQMTNEQAGEEVRIRAKAKEKLEQILSKFDINEAKEPSIDQVQRAKDKAGL